VLCRLNSSACGNCPRRIMPIRSRTSPVLRSSFHTDHSHVWVRSFRESSAQTCRVPAATEIAYKYIRNNFSTLGDWRDKTILNAVSAAKPEKRQRRLRTQTSGQISFPILPRETRSQLCFRDFGKARGTFDG
jgi:hypothetical protein